MIQPLRVLLALACLACAGCATQPVGQPDPRDPLERINRVTFAFNDTLDRAVARPLARTYRNVAPRFVRTGVANFMDNAGYPVVLVNNLLQGKLVPAASDAGRFLLNTTLGLGGLLDPATAAGLPRHEEDFGQTLGRWGVSPGPYLMVPFFGPYTLRDGFGALVDEFADPRTYIERDRVRYGLWAVRALDARTRLLDAEQVLERAYDRYGIIRSVYLQRREYLVRDGEVPEESLEDDDWVEEAEREASEEEEEGKGL